MSAAGQAVVAALEVGSSSRAALATFTLDPLPACLCCHWSALSCSALSAPTLGLYTWVTRHAARQPWLSLFAATEHVVCDDLASQEHLHLLSTNTLVLGTCLLTFHEVLHDNSCEAQQSLLVSALLTLCSLLLDVPGLTCPAGVWAAGPPGRAAQERGVRHGPGVPGVGQHAECQERPQGPGRHGLQCCCW